MLSRKAWETAGFITIAAALHVSAAAYFVGEPAEINLPPGPVTGSFSAGGGEIGEMIEKWESQPETGAVQEPAQPELPQQEIDVLPPQPQAAASEVSTSRPNLPEPPIIEQSEIDEFEPPEIDLEPSLALAASARPERRPARPEPEPEREVRREARPQTQQKAVSQRQPARSGGQGTGGGGGGGVGRAGGGGGTSMSASQRVNLISLWEGLIQSCVANAIHRTRISTRRERQVRITASIAPSGSVLRATLAASSGDARVDRDAVRAVGRIGRCPPAPAGITGSRILEIPITIQPG